MQNLKETTKKILRPPYHAAKRIAGFIEYVFAMVFDRPYFGTFMMANQCHKPRIAVMERLVKNIAIGAETKDENLMILEIGAWAGVSTSIWARAARAFALRTGRRAKVYVIDTWQTTPAAPLAMLIATKGDRIFKLFKHNIRSARLDKYVEILRGTSDEQLTRLAMARMQFDLIYVDGDHAYQQVKNDILNCLPLLKEGGRICGDDLELQYKDLRIDKKFAEENREVDYIADPNTGIGYHPGVTIAVNEVLGTVAEENGFWHYQP